MFVPLTKVPMTSRGLTDVTKPAIEHKRRKTACVIVKAEIKITTASNSRVPIFNHCKFLGFLREY